MFSPQSLFKIRAIFNKEMKSLFRDRKALITIFLPVVLYPVMLILFLGIMNLIEGDTSKQIMALNVDQNISKDLLKILESDKTLKITSVTLSEEAIQSLDFQTTQGYLEVQGKATEAQKGTASQTYTLHYHSSYDSSVRLFRSVSDHYETFAENQKNNELKKLGISDAYANVLNIKIQEISGEKQGDARLISMALGLIVPFIIVLYGMLGTYTLSSDISAGEKERATLETIFSVPIKRAEIITGKLLSCVAVGLLSGGINLLALFPVLFAVTTQFPDIQIRISVGVFAFLFLMLIPVMILFSALFIAVGMASKTFQESQSYGSVLLVALMMPCYIAIIPDLEASTWVHLTPITNAMFLMREAFLGTYHLGTTLMVLAINMGVAALAVFVMSVLFSNDRIVFGGSKS